MASFPAIQRADVDGSEVETFASGVGLPWAIAVIPEPGTLPLLAVGSLVMLPIKAGRGMLR